MSECTLNVYCDEINRWRDIDLSAGEGGLIYYLWRRSDFKLRVLMRRGLWDGDIISSESIIRVWFTVDDDDDDDDDDDVFARCIQRFQLEFGEGFGSPTTSYPRRRCAMCHPGGGVDR
ncbi:hypothetical protein ACMFMF_010625 [Clarireedia jacksonii]